MPEATLLVTGASGHLGRRVVDFLLEAGVRAGRIIATTRTPDKLADLSAQGVIVRHADFNDSASLRTAFAGADRLLLISTDTVGTPGLRISQHTNAVSAADTVGVKHVLYTSIINPTDTPVVLAADHAATEAALESSGVGYTLLRNSIYAEVTVGTIRQALQLGGKIYSAAGDGKTAYVTREDCARAAAAALNSDFEGRHALNITGGEALTQSDLAVIGAQITGTPIEYVPLPLDVLVQNMVGAGLPQGLAEAYASFDVGIAQSKFADVSGDFKALTGRDPQRVADFLKAQLSAEPAA